MGPVVRSAQYRSASRNKSGPRPPGRRPRGNPASRAPRPRSAAGGPRAWNPEAPWFPRPFDEEDGDDPSYRSS